MPTIQESIVIQQPPEVVFAYISDYTRDPQWREGVVEMTQSTAPTQLGVTTVELLEFNGEAYETEAEVVEFEPNRKVAFRATSSQYPTHGWRTVEPVEGGTRFTYYLDIEMGGMMRLFAPLMGRMFTQTVRHSLQKLKDILEAPTA